MSEGELLNRALAFHRQGRLADAEQLYLAAMTAAPQDAAAPHLLGVVRAQQGRNREALELMTAALKLKPDAPEILSNYGNVLKTEGRPAEALVSFDRAIALKPDYAAAWSRRAQALRDLGRLADALESVERALSLNPKNIEALNVRGALLSELRRPKEALAAYDQALRLAPDFPDTLNNRALLLKNLRRLEEALASVERALTVHGAMAEAWNNRGIILFDLKRMGEAIASYDRALALQPGYAEALNNRAVAKAGLKRFADSLADCDQALALKPDFADALYNRGNALSELSRPQEALADYERALEIDPNHPSAFSGLANAALLIGDWQRTATLKERLKDDVLADRSMIQPFVVMGYWDDNELQLKAAQHYVQRSGPGPLPALWRGGRYDHDKIRVAYLSADFHSHVTAALTAEMFERHDRERFQITAMSFGPDDGSAMRARLMKAFDHFHDARQQSDRDVAELLKAMEIDIAVDLGGHTSGARPWVLAHRPCPVQAKYMGYPGTSGTDFIDYLIADRTVVPPDQEKFFSEKVAALPDTLWVTDTARIVPTAPTRAETGLPETGFVFCCFNHNWKITAPIFDVWMRLLHQVDGSVLWLLEGNAAIGANLRKEAAARGIAPERLIFAGRTTPDQHLARQQVADLFLDTLPYNAHTTASDALWAGLPLVTLPGQSFPARVAASILKAANLPELIVPDLAAYENLALKLARDPAVLKSIREKLTDKSRMPLFDTARFTRNLEAAYLAMLRQMQEKPA
jgi:predicted O-linked N-acetylglucosamine transferase (SPINDLY family)